MAKQKAEEEEKAVKGKEKDQMADAMSVEDRITQASVRSGRGGKVMQKEAKEVQARAHGRQCNRGTGTLGILVSKRASGANGGPTKAKSRRLREAKEV